MRKAAKSKPIGSDPAASGPAGAGRADPPPAGAGRRAEPGGPPKSGAAAKSAGLAKSAGPVKRAKPAGPAKPARSGPGPSKVPPSPAERTALERLSDPRHVRLAHLVRRRGGRLLLVGGQVREAMMAMVHGDFRPDPAARPGGDRDAVVFGLGIEELRGAARKLGPAWVIDQRTLSDRESKVPALVNLRIDGDDFALTICRRIEGRRTVLDPGASVADDALSRDFTVNSVYFDPLGAEGLGAGPGGGWAGDARGFIDPLGGFADLKARRLEVSSPLALEMDPARILRAMGLVSRLGFTPGPALLEAARRSWPRLALIPPDRLWPEWRKWAASRRPRLGLDFLRHSGALAFWPEFAAMVGSPQYHKFHPEGDAWTHTVLVVQALSRLDLPLSDGRVFLTMACLLHDVGKPLVTVVRPDGRVSTRGHAQAGLPLAARFLEAVQCPARIRKPVLRLIEHHMDLSFREPGTINLKVLARRLAPFCDLLHFWAMAAADWNGRGPFPTAYPWSLEEFLEPVGGLRAPGPPPLSPTDLMASLGLSGGPVVGRLMGVVDRAFDLGRVSTREQALELAAAALADPDLKIEPETPRAVL